MTSAIVLVKENKNYRRIAQEHWGLTDEQMVGMHVHHWPPRALGGQNVPEHLYVCSPTMHYMGWHKGERGNHLDCFLNVSKETRAENGRKNVYLMLAHPNTAKARKRNVALMNSHPNTTKARVKNGKKNGEKQSKAIELTNIRSGLKTFFVSLNAACRALDLHPGHMSQVATGKRKQHKGYIAKYL